MVYYCVQKYINLAKFAIRDININWILSVYSWDYAWKLIEQQWILALKHGIMISVWTLYTSSCLYFCVWLFSSYSFLRKPFQKRILMKKMEEVKKQKNMLVHFTFPIIITQIMEQFLSNELEIDGNKFWKMLKILQQGCLVVLFIFILKKAISKKDINEENHQSKESIEHISYFYIKLKSVLKNVIPKKCRKSSLIFQDNDLNYGAILV